MGWFHYTKQERLRRNRELRREQAEHARKEAQDNVFTISPIVKEALRDAGEEERLFQDYFGEAMPNHVQMAVRLEIILWRRIQASLERIEPAHMDEQQFAAFVENVRSILMHLIDLLHAEEEMLTSCLVRHYLTIIQAVQADAARVTL